MITKWETYHSPAFRWISLVLQVFLCAMFLIAGQAYREMQQINADLNAENNALVHRAHARLNEMTPAINQPDPFVKWVEAVKEHNRKLDVIGPAKVK